MQSKAQTVREYLASLPEDRRKVVEAVRKVIRKNLDRDYEEGMQYGMIGYFVPHRVYPAGYHCDPKQPLPFVCLASQKNHLSLYMMCLYFDGEEAGWFRQAWVATGKKLDMGKSCIRFKRAEDLALDVIGQAIRRAPARKYIEFYERVLKQPGKGSAKKSAASATNGRKPSATKKKSAAKKKIALKKKSSVRRGK